MPKKTQPEDREELSGHGLGEQVAAGAAPEQPVEANPEETAADHNTETPAGEHVAELQRQLEEKTQLASEYLDRLQRLTADFDNFRRRAQKEKEDLATYGAEQFLKSVLPVLDNLERALAVTGDVRAGVELTARMLRETLAKAGVQPIPAQGELFNPEVHMAVAVDAEADAPEDTIVDELQTGYRLGDRVLRPSMVKVAKK